MSQPPQRQSAGRRGAVRPASLLAGLLLLYALVCAALFVGQRSLLYRPDTRLAEPQGLPGVQAVRLHTADGQVLVAWWSPPATPDHPVVLYLHGNGAHLAARQGRFSWFAARGDGVLALSWRGYGGSSGSPSEAGLREDAATAWRALTSAADTSLPGRGVAIAPRRVLVFGESLGSTVAVMLAAEVQPGAVMLDSAFSSVLDVAQRHYPWLPVAWLLRDPFRADLAAPRVLSPVLQIHCRDDPVTPRAAAEGLHSLLTNAQALLIVPDRCHVPSLRQFEPALADFIARHFGRAQPG